MENVLSVGLSHSGVQAMIAGRPLPCSLGSLYSLKLLTDFFVAGRQAAGKEGSGWAGLPYQGTQWL
jgi:hypothetical protein